nr:hypothetical protein CFP56_20367 [Quercus suber]
MLSRLTSLWAPSPRYSSVVLILQPDPTSHYTLHIVPEDGAIERVHYTLSKPAKFGIGGCKEMAREQLGTVQLRADDYDQPTQFVDEVRENATQILSGRSKGGSTESNADSTERALRSAVLDSLKKWEQQDWSSETTQPYEAFLVHIDRRKPGRLRNPYEPRSIARW